MRYLSQEAIAARNRRRNVALIGHVPKRSYWQLHLLTMVVVSCLIMAGCQAFLSHARDIVHRATDCVFDDESSSCSSDSPHSK